MVSAPASWVLPLVTLRNKVQYTRGRATKTIAPLFENVQLVQYSRVLYSIVLITIEMKSEQRAAAGAPEAGGRDL